MDHATARNRALLWLFWETGLLVTEVCGLCLSDVDRAQGQVRIQGPGATERWVPLGSRAFDRSESRDRRRGALSLGKASAPDSQCYHPAVSQAEPTCGDERKRSHSFRAARYLRGAVSPAERPSENVAEAVGVSKQSRTQALP
jgi:integrase